MSKKKETQMENGQEDILGKEDKSEDKSGDEDKSVDKSEDKSEGPHPDDEKKSREGGDPDPKEKLDVEDDKQEEISISEAYAALGDRYAESVREAEISAEEIKILKNDNAILLEDVEIKKKQIEDLGKEEKPEEIVALEGRIEVAEKRALKLERILEDRDAAIKKLQEQLKRARKKKGPAVKFMAH